MPAERDQASGDPRSLLPCWFVMSGDAAGRGVGMPAERDQASGPPRRSRRELTLPPLSSSGVTSGSCCSVQFGDGIWRRIV